ncbi:hypothetical protein [Paenibacillus xylanilyticus]|uniref:ATP-dependent DNA ligase n=1 Tax=Paenibacillus xylanilyticus TaxID=248903 RepID=UPI00399FC88B
MELEEAKGSLHPCLWAKSVQTTGYSGATKHLKLDGIRGILEIGPDSRLYSRHQNEISARYPELIEARKAALDSGTIIDGEIVVSDLATGKPDFVACSRRFQMKPPKQGTPGLTYVAFDILQYKGKDVTKLDLMSRKELLQTAVQENEKISKSRFIEHSFIPFFELIQKQELEGIVIKQKNSAYYTNSRPKKLWQRVVNYKRETCVILGFSNVKAAWLLGVERDGEFIPVGMVKFGLTPDIRKKVYPVLKENITKQSGQFSYVRPCVYVDVRFREWTAAGKMRLPVVDRVHNL